MIILRIPSDRLEDQKRQLLKVNVESGKATILLDEPGSNHQALGLSAANDQIVFQKSQDNWQSSQVWAYDLKTTQEKKIANDGFKPRWMP